MTAGRLEEKEHRGEDNQSRIEPDRSENGDHKECSSLGPIESGFDHEYQSQDHIPRSDWRDWGPVCKANRPRKTTRSLSDESEARGKGSLKTKKTTTY